MNHTKRDPTKIFGEKDSSDAWLVEDQNKWLETGYVRHHHRKRVNYIIRTIRNFKSSKNQKILDIGCGDGSLTKHLEKINNNEVYGSDLSPLRIKRAEEICKKSSFLLANALYLPFEDNTFDVILLHHVLEHIPDDEGIIKEIYRILKVGGVFILGVPNEGSIMGNILHKVEPQILKTTDHVHFYTSKILSHKLLKSSFKIEDTGYIGFFIPFQPLHSRLIRFKFIYEPLHLITQVLKFTADSLFFVARKERQ